jgi:hypothetical protein
LNTNKDPPTT